MKKLCFTCDLKNDPELIEEYKRHHLPENIWPEISESIKSAGILNMEIYLSENRMFMIMTVSNSFDLHKKAEMDGKNPKVQEWEKLMWKYQQAVPWAKQGEKWMLMESIFSL